MPLIYGGRGVSLCRERGLRCKIAHDILLLGDVLHQSSLCSQQSLFHLKDLIGRVGDTRPLNTFLLTAWFESCHFQDSRSAQRADRRWSSSHYRIPEFAVHDLVKSGSENTDCNHWIPVLNSPESTVAVRVIVGRITFFPRPCQVFVKELTPVRLLRLQSRGVL